MVGAIKIEMLSADVIEGSEISTENRYPVEYFRDQTLPDPEETEDIIDWDSIYEEAPEVKMFIYRIMMRIRQRSPKKSWTEIRT